MLDFVVIGAGICGCNVAYFLNKAGKNVLLVDKNQKVAGGASGAAGAFLSPLLGKNNKFKTLVNQALRYSTEFYKQNFEDCITNNGVLRIPKNQTDREKFKNYDHDFEFSEIDDGYFFEIGSLVDSAKVCEKLSFGCEKRFEYEVSSISREENLWIINGEIKTKNIILATGAKIDLIDEPWLKIRPVWGQRIVVESDLPLTYSYHKECSVSPNINGRISIGATHHRFVYEKDVSDEDAKKLLELANSMIPIKNPKIIDMLGGARSASEDYLPILGKIIDAKATLKEFPYIIHGTKVKNERFTRYENLYFINGVGGRGFVLAPFLAKLLSENILQDSPINDEILCDRLFLREVKR